MSAPKYPEQDAPDRDQRTTYPDRVYRLEASGSPDLACEGNPTSSALPSRLWRRHSVLAQPAGSWSEERWAVSEFLRRAELADVSTWPKWTLTDDRSFGDWLRRERVEAGVTIEAISSSTRIPAWILVGIEQNRLREVPGGHYTRAFLRQYADVVGLDPNRVLLGLDFYSGAYAIPSDHQVLQALSPSATEASHRRAGERARQLGVRFASAAFRLAETLLPARICNEELGDATEFISLPERAWWEVWLKTFTTLFWVFTNTLRELRMILQG